MLRLIFIGIILFHLETTAQVLPKRLLIYYSYPSSLNYPQNQYNIAAVINDFSQYDYLVFGSGLEESTHPDHANTQQIMAGINTNGRKVFGYVDLGVSTSNLSIAQMESKVLKWKAMGAAGIFLDDFGFDYNVTRERQNGIVSYIHDQNLPVIANAWNPDDVFGSAVVAGNPSALAPVLLATDFYLSESFGIMEGNFNANRAKADKLKAYQALLPFKILSITTNAAATSEIYDQNKFHFAWYLAALDGHEAAGWGEYLFASSGNINALSPYRSRPLVTANAVLKPSSIQGDLLFKFYDTGRLYLDLATHLGGMDGYLHCQSTQSGNWENPNVWNCGREPFPYDEVTIKANHKITLAKNATTLTESYKFKTEPGAVFLALSPFLSSATPY